MPGFDLKSETDGLGKDLVGWLARPLPPLRMALRFSLLLLALVLSLPAQAQRIVPDAGFFSAPAEWFGYRSLDTAVDLKDRPLHVGRARDFPSRELSIVRVQPNGALDPSFDGGEVTFKGPEPTPGDRAIGFGARIDHDALDRVVVVGSFLSEAIAQPFVLRLLEDGTPDPEIGPSGARLLDFGFGVEVTGLAIVDRTVYLGLHSPTAGICFVAALGADGRPDEAFGARGLAEVKSDGACASRDLLATDDGLYLLSEIGDGSRDVTAVSAFGFGGAPRGGFGVGGQVRFEGAPLDFTPTTLAAWNGDVVVAGTTRADEGETGLFVTRLRPDGSRDDTFADAGLYTGETPGDPNALRVGLAVSRGSLIVATSARETATQFTLLATAFGPSGARITQDGPDGFYRDVRTSEPSREYIFQSVAAETDSQGRVVVGAWRVISGGGLSRAQIVRLIVEPPQTSVDADDGPAPSAPLALAPNPAAGAAWVTLDRPATVTIVDLMGREVARTAGRGRLALPTRGLAPGLYHVVATIDGRERQSARLSLVR